MGKRIEISREVGPLLRGVWFGPDDLLFIVVDRETMPVLNVHSKAGREAQRMTIKLTSLLSTL
jgi:hypothetical protein